MNSRQTALRRFMLFGGGLLCVSILMAAYITIRASNQAYTHANLNHVSVSEPFPVSVNPDTQVITEDESVQSFYYKHIAAGDLANASWLNRLANVFQTSATFQQLASPISRVIVIWPGERTEEIVNNIGDVLRWDQVQRDEFITLLQTNEFDFDQGLALPGQYTSHRYATPQDINTMLAESFSAEVTARYPDEIASVIPLSDTLIIASLIEREASDFENMREVSGVIWNRLFIDMPLQLDASLQYVKAEDPYELNYWPAVRPPDKFIDSPFNTYQNEGLPPAPIANPSVAAIVAALNPRETECLYYFHSRSREYYCSQTYPEHVEKLREVYNLPN